MSQAESMPTALFVSTNSALSDQPGGVQLCTREYRTLLEYSGWLLKTVAFDFDRSMQARIRRRFLDRPYRYRIPAALVNSIVTEYNKSRSSVIFLTQCDVLSIVAELRRALPDAKLVFLSYGLESVDFLHTLRSRAKGTPFQSVRLRDERRLAQQLIAECKQRSFLDAVICLSEFEVEIERWLGARCVTWLPRIVRPDYLDWKPVSKRVGFVGTLDHPPNAEGLVLFLRELQEMSRDVRIRVVGGPAADGERLVGEFSCIDYLGQLSDQELAEEARTWCGFLHPLFCYPRGASTKLAIGISWGLPIVTTAAGRRGYSWKRGSLVESSDAADFARQVCKLCSDERFAERAREETRLVCQSSPTIATVSAQLQEFMHQLLGRSVPHGANCPESRQQ